MNVQEYLDRIGFTGPKPDRADLANLKRLHNCHQSSVPFENFDAMRGTITNLTLEDLYGKIVKQRMGGWCFQLNGLFHWLLTELGFNVTMTGSSVGRDNGEWGNVKDHMALIAQIDGKRYLVDIGFGQYRNPYDPIEMFDGSESEQPNGCFKLNREGDYWMLYHKKLEETWKIMYRFKDDWPLRLSDFQDIHETYTFGRDPSGIGLIAKPMAQIKGNEGKDSKAYVMDIFRHYTNTGSTANKKLIQKKDDLDKNSIEQLLLQEFGLRVDMSLVKAGPSGSQGTDVTENVLGHIAP